MEKSSGLKECPRCGLRNRRGAYQCDFCGWDFKAASDDWMGKVNDLEKIGREVEVTSIDRSTRSKIELTMKKPADVPPKERKPEKQLEVSDHLTLEDQGDVVAQTTAETCAETETEPALYQESDIAEAVVSLTINSSSEPLTPAKVDETPHVGISTHHKAFDMPMITFMSLIGTGLSLYVVDLYMTTSQTLGRELGWGIAIVASALIAFAVMRLLPLLKKGGSEEEELVLCPVCHEVVTEQDNKCPSCGVKFKETSSRE